MTKQSVRQEARKQSCGSLITILNAFQSHDRRRTGVSPMCPRPNVSTAAQCVNDPLCQRPNVYTTRCVNGPMCPSFMVTLQGYYAKTSTSSNHCQRYYTRSSTSSRQILHVITPDRPCHQTIVHVITLNCPCHYTIVHVITLNLSLIHI